MKTLKWLAALSMVFILAGCCSCRKNKSSRIPLVGTEWKLTQLGGESVVSEMYRMTLSEDGRITGVGDCNRFNGAYTLKDKTLEISQNMAVTRIFCPDQEREDRFFNMMFEIDTYSIDGRKLMLIRDGNVLAIFEPVDENLK